MGESVDNSVEERRKLLAEELRRLLSVLEEERPPERVILFGSLAQGIVEEWSDIDVVVIQDSDLPFRERGRRLYERLKPKVAVDIFIYTPAEFAEIMSKRRFFREEVLAKGRVIYERGKTLV